MRRLSSLVLALAVGLGVLTGCSGDDDSPDADPTSPTSPTVAAVEPAKPAPRPANGACYRLDYRAALAPTSDARPVGCRTRHTAQTFFVGPLDTVVDGHLLAVDSARVRRQLATVCPRRFAAYVGGSVEARRLSMLAAISFSPTLDQSDQGQSWLRCDLIAADSPGRLALLTGRMRGALETAPGRSRWGRCATAGPGSRAARHVVCSRNDAWRAIASVDVRPGRRGAWPGTGAARAAGDGCEARVRAIADDKLSFRWGYEPPTRAQWRAGQRYGFCWAPRNP